METDRQAEEVNPKQEQPHREPFPRGFRVYAALLGIAGAGAVGSPFVLRGFVSQDVSDLRSDFKVMQSEQKATNETLKKIEQALAPALDWQAERDRIESVIYLMVKDDALVKPKK